MTTVPVTEPAVVSLPVVRAYVRNLRKERSRSRVLGIRAQPVWNGPDPVRVDGVDVHVRACVSALAVREALVEHGARPAADYLVVVTDVDDLGHGICAHLATGRLQAVQLWQAVKESFDAREIDPLLVAEKVWAPRTLVDHEPAGGWPPAPSGVLTRDFALGHLARAVLGRDAAGDDYVDAEHPDAEGLLRWSGDPTALRRWQHLDDGARSGLWVWLSERTGHAGTWTLNAVAAGHGPDAVALGLAAGLLWHESANAQAVGVARGLLLARLGGSDLPEYQARAWARTVGAYVAASLTADDPRAVAAIARAESLLAELNATTVVALSDLLTGAFIARLRRLADALGTALRGAPTEGGLERVEAASVALGEHELGRRDPRATTAAMALRLLRWLVASPAPGSAADAVRHLKDALDRQVHVDAWVDRALADVWCGDPDPQVATAYQALAEVVLARRAEHDRQLAELVATATADDADLGSILPVENVLAAVVRPLARERPVLLLVVDGMSTGVITAVTEALRVRRWVELVPEASQRRQAVLPVLPTLTGVSRTSLLTGTLRAGTQTDEQKGFAAAVGGSGKLFHKGDLRSPAGTAMSPALRDALTDERVGVVGVVLNTVDDSLDKMDPGGTVWGVDAIQHLGHVLDVARESDRVVVLTSDHGHVVERGSELRQATGAGARWRPAASGPAGEGEIRVTGARVLRAGNDVVLPWREDIRYVPKAAGYHGGISAAEVTIPLTVHVSGAVDDLAGWVPGPPPEPLWWLSPLTPGRPVIVESPSAPAPGVPAGTRAAAPRRPSAELTLFDDVTEGDPVTELVTALLAGDVYASQRSRSGRGAPADDRVRAVLEHLLRAGGRLHQTTLATAAGIPAARLATTLAAVRRVLSVDGYEALSVDADGVTLVLDVTVLREQFDLKARS